MTLRAATGVTQKCPNCQRVHDIGVYVSGQRVVCSCGIKFDVVRKDVSMVAPAASRQTSDERPPKTGEVLIPPVAKGFENTIVSAALQEIKIPGFEILETLGRGGMGEVYKARQVSLNRIVAVKVLPARFSNDPEFVGRFEKEATALAALNHPNIIQIIDRGRVDSHYYFVMEYVQGRTLRESMNSGPMRPQLALRQARDIAAALTHAHERGIIHRDLKPENILIDGEERLRVADFGLAGFRTGGEGLGITRSAVAMGTVNYMAPEQRKDAKTVDHRADLYALGVLLYEMLTHELPVGRFKMPSNLSQTVPLAVDDLVMQLIDQDPNVRPNSTRAVHDALVNLVNPSSSSHISASVIQSVKGPKLLTVIKLVAVVFALALFAFAVKSFTSTVQNARPQTKAPAWYKDTENTLNANAKVEDNSLVVDFNRQGNEAINAHAGMWSIQDGALTAMQFGEPLSDDLPRLIPRAYLGSRYYSSDDVRVETEMQLEELSPAFPPIDKDDPGYGELAFRIKDVQVSLLAIPTVGMSAYWRYFSKDGAETLGSTDSEVEKYIEDSVRVPRGKFRLALQLTKVKGDNVMLQGFVNGQRFVRKTLSNFAGQTAKIALGCRNLECRFGEIQVSGKPALKPKVNAETSAGPNQNGL